MLLTLYKFKYLFAKQNDKIVNVEADGKGKFYISADGIGGPAVKRQYYKKSKPVRYNHSGLEI
jgi:hypothetical protein